VTYSEFEASAHMPLPSDDVFQIAAEIHLSMPDGSAPDGQDRPLQLQRQLEQALQRLETEANKGLAV
jgi:hypothetical protein